MYEKLEVCPACLSSHIENYNIVKDHSISKENFVLQKCLNCQLIFTNPRPDKENINKYYQADHYISHSDKTLGAKDLVYKLIRSIALKNKISLIQKLTDGRKLLDYGSGAGHFLLKAKHSGYEVYGVEPNLEARENSNHILGSTTVFPSIDFIKSNKLDVITLWHVLEHIHDLQNILSTLKQKLEKTGYLIVAVPNIESHDSKHYGLEWAALDVPRHLYHFNQHSVKMLMKKHKLKVKNILPMKFDSYYVSLLSEQYQQHSLSPIRAIKQGLKSNNLAKSTGEYSSLIYIIQHA